jgi:quinoprotein relay system zinc metallohydrolase 2
MHKISNLLKVLLRLASLLTLMAPFSVIHADQSVTSADAPPRLFQLDEIAPGVFVHQGETAMMSASNLGGIANLGAIVGDDAVAVIDTGGSLIEAKIFLQALHEKTPKPIRYVINTHAHPDHVFGNGAFRDPGVTFVGHKNLPLALATRGGFYLSAFQNTMGSALQGVEIVAPSLTVSDRLVLDLGRRHLELIAWKTSHSDCDLTIMDQTSGTLFTGDLLFLRHVPVVDGSLLGFLEVAEQLAAIPAKRAVPGHGPAVAPWPDALNNQRAYLLRLTADLRAAIRRGSGVSETAKTAGRNEAAKWSLFENYNARNATTGYAELEWETP